MAGGSRRAVFAALGADLGIAIAKFVGFEERIGDVVPKASLIYVEPDIHRPA